MTARNMRHRGRSWTAPRRARRHTIVARLEFPAILSNTEDKLMENLVWIGRVSGLLGVLLFIVAGIVRLTGRFFLGGFQVGTLLQVAIAGMILACYCFLLVLTERMRPH